ncbi:hypothetical protein [Microbulbifer variabilis]|uniref:hypothetical protein n=1 Tax=Microbulbifer variabilis TaxID=266805 RepID=UPI001CFDC749|nr:hypothetical protein [Microbulbifer variabilis]
MIKNSKQTYPMTETRSTNTTSLLVAAQSQSISLAVQEGLCLSVAPSLTRVSKGKKGIRR